MQRRIGSGGILRAVLSFARTIRPNRDGFLARIVAARDAVACRSIFLVLTRCVRICRLLVFDYCCVGEEPLEKAHAAQIACPETIFVTRSRDTDFVAMQVELDCGAGFVCCIARVRPRRTLVNSVAMYSGDASAGSSQDRPRIAGIRVLDLVVT